MISSIARSDRRLLVGPWLSGTTDEILYWIPFLRRLAERYELAPSRITAVSRGGIRSWYEGICSDYVDALELVDGPTAHEALRESGDQGRRGEQMEAGPLDQELVAAAVAREGLEDAVVLHPSSMLRLFREHRQDRVASAVVLEQLSFCAFERGDPNGLREQLPAEYVAVSFLGGTSAGSLRREVVETIVDHLTAGTPVVLLDEDGAGTADLAPLPIAARRDVLRPLAGVAPAQRLRAQSIVIGGARAFVGTYGGLCHVAIAHGVHALALVVPGGRVPAPSDSVVARALSAATGASLSLLAAPSFETLAAAVTSGAPA